MPLAKQRQAPSGGGDEGTIVFFHPDLGIGGAERLVVDAAVGLQSRGYRTVIFTNHCDPKHCFDECHNGTLDVRVRASQPIPLSIFSRVTILCAILRHLQLLAQITLSGELAALRPRVFVVDQLSAGLPFLRSLCCPDVPILFYCHFPDLLLARGREASWLKRTYRKPFDAIEAWSMGFSSAVAVNSHFTKGVVAQTWPALGEKFPLQVVYPCIDIDAANENQPTSEAGEKKLLDGDRIVLSINRFERKKDIALAVKAFAAVPQKNRNGVRLVLAGGYDPRVSENVEYHTELQSLASSLRLTHHTLTPRDLASSPSPLSPSPAAAEILFLLSVPSTLKIALLRAATLLIYTPSNEHFGIVPLEAMLARVPVLAANTGGPVETVVDGITGWLCDPLDPDAWAAALHRALGLDAASSQLAEMGRAGKARVTELFARDAMAGKLEQIANSIISAEKRRTRSDSAGFWGLLAGAFVLMGGILISSLYVAFMMLRRD